MSGHERGDRVPHARGGVGRHGGGLHRLAVDRGRWCALDLTGRLWWALWLGAVVLLGAAAPVRAAPPSGWEGVCVTTSGNVTSTASANTPHVSWNVETFDTAGAFDPGVPDVLTVPAAWDGLMGELHASALWIGFSGTGQYAEMKAYRGAPDGVDGNLVGLSQHTPNTSNTATTLRSRPLELVAGDTYRLTLRSNSARTVYAYAAVSPVFCLTVLPSGGSGSAGPPGPTGPPGPAGADGASVCISAAPVASGESPAPSEGECMVEVVGVGGSALDWALGIFAVGVVMVALAAGTMFAVLTRRGS